MRRCNDGDCILYEVIVQDRRPWSWMVEERTDEGLELKSRRGFCPQKLQKSPPAYLIGVSHVRYQNKRQNLAAFTRQRAS